VKTAIALCWLFLSFSAAGAECFSSARPDVYSSDVVFGEAFQNFYLGPKGRSLHPTPLSCREREFSVFVFYKKIKTLKRELQKYDKVLISVPKNYKMVFSYYLRTLKNVEIIPCPQGDSVKIKLCKEVQK